MDCLPLADHTLTQSVVFFDGLPRFFLAIFILIIVILFLFRGMLVKVGCGVLSPTRSRVISQFVLGHCWAGSGVIGGFGIVRRHLRNERQSQ